MHIVAFSVWRGTASQLKLLSLQPVLVHMYSFYLCAVFLNMLFKAAALYRTTRCLLGHVSLFSRTAIILLFLLFQALLKIVFSAMHAYIFSLAYAGCAVTGNICMLKNESHLTSGMLSKCMLGFDLVLGGIRNTTAGQRIP